MHAGTEKTELKRKVYPQNFTLLNSGSLKTFSLMRILSLKRQGIQLWAKASIQNYTSIYTKPPNFFSKLLMRGSTRGSGRVLCRSWGKVGRMQLPPTSLTGANEVSSLLFDHHLGGGDTRFHTKMRLAQQSLKFCYVKSDCCYWDGKWRCGNGIISKFWHELVVTGACLQGHVQAGCKVGEGHSGSDSLPLNDLWFFLYSTETTPKSLISFLCMELWREGEHFYLYH